MKKYFLIAALFCAMAFVGCEKEEDITPPDGSEEQTPNGDEDNNETTEEDVVIPEAMGIAFPDSIFCAYVLDNFDTDKNGKISKEEAAAVTWIDVDNYDNRNDESKCIKSLEGIQYFTNLRTLYCWSNQLTSLDVSKNTELTYLYCSGNQLTTLDVSKNTELTYLDCSGNQLTTLDVSKNTQLEYLYCNSNGLTSLDVSNNTQLLGLHCTNTQLTTLDVSKNTQLTSLRCHYNQLTTLDLSKNTQLTELWCNSNQLTTLDVSKTNLGNSTYLSPLYCSDMSTLQTLYLKYGWSIRGITYNRSTIFIPAQTQIVFVD